MKVINFKNCKIIVNKVELNETKNQLTHKLRYGINKFTNSQIVDKLNIKKLA